MSAVAVKDENRVAFECINAPEPVAYPAAISFMEQRVADIHAGRAPETLWLLEHPPLYTAGTSAQDKDLLEARFPVFKTGRGGQYTYHGPGQRVGYAMLDLRKRGHDLHKFVCGLEDWLISSLQAFGVSARKKPGLVGLWVGDAKIAAIGVRVRKYITYHGISLNINPDLSHFSGIVPCGLRDFGITSLAALGVAPSPEEIDRVLEAEFCRVFWA